MQLIRRLLAMLGRLWAFLRQLIWPAPPPPTSHIPPAGRAPRAGFANSVEHADQRGVVPIHRPEGPRDAV